MTSQLIKIDGRYVYFFVDIESALEEADFFEDFDIYQYNNCQLYVVGEKDTLEKKRSHLYDWNGLLFPVRRGDSEEMENWRVEFKNKLSKIAIFTRPHELIEEAA